MVGKGCCMRMRNTRTMVPEMWFTDGFVILTGWGAVLAVILAEYYWKP